MTIFKKKKETKSENKETKKATRKSALDKLLDEKAKERVDSFKKTLEKVSKFKKINGFIVLVDAEGDKELSEDATGICSMCGPKPNLYKLLANVDKDFLKEALNYQDFKNNMEGLSGVLSELSKLVEKMNEKKDN